MNLQLFAEEEVKDEVDNQVAEKEANDEKQERTFNRADVGKMIAAEVAKEREKWEAEQQEAIEKARSEGERLAKLTKEQREKEEEEKRVADLDKREKELAMKELRIETRTLLSEEGLPLEFLDLVISDTAEQIQTNIANVRKVFDEAVNKAVDNRLAQTKPRTGALGGSLTKTEIMAISDPHQRQQLIAENKHLFMK